LSIDELKAIPGVELKALHKRFGYISWSDDKAKELIKRIKSAEVRSLYFA
jgi:hypothetical protein